MVGDTSGANLRRRLERAERVARSVAPDPPDPEQTRREAERFLNGWAEEVVRVAHSMRAARDRGEVNERPIGERSGLEVMAEAVSFGGFQPPESVRRALREQLDQDAWPELADDPERQAFLNSIPREVLRLAFNRYIQETAGPGAGE